MLKCEYDGEKDDSIPKQRKGFLPHHLILKHICSNKEESIPLGLISNTLEDHII